MKVARSHVASAYDGGVIFCHQISIDSLAYGCDPYLISIYVFSTKLIQQTFREIMYGIPNTDETDSNDGDKDNDNIPWMHADRIGIDHEGPLAATQGYDAELLLQPAKE